MNYNNLEINKEIWKKIKDYENYMISNFGVDVGIDGNLANYDLISLEKLANHLTKIEKDNEHGMVK